MLDSVVHGKTLDRNAAHRFKDAAVAAIGAGDIEKTADLYKKQIRSYKKDKDFECAALLAKKAGDTKAADKFYKKQIKRYERVGAFYSCAQLARKMGDNETAIKFYEKGRLFDDAAALAAESGDYGLAKELYGKQINLYKERGKPEFVGRVLKKVEEIEKEELASMRRAS